MDGKKYTLEHVLQLHEKYIFPIDRKNHYRYPSYKSTAISHVKHICLALDLPFTESINDISFGYDVYSTLERFYQNQALVLQGEFDVITLRESMDIIGRGASHTSYTMMKQSNSRNRNRWKELIRAIPTQLYCNGKFYFSKADVVQFSNSIVSTKECYDLLVEKYERRLAFNTLQKVLRTRYSNEVISFLGLMNCYPARIVEELVKEFPRSFKGYYSTAEVSKLLGLRERFVFRCVKETNVFSGVIKEGNSYYFPIAEIEKWLKFMEDTTEFSQFIVDFLEKNDVHVDKPYSDNLTFVQLSNFVLATCKESAIVIITGEQTPFPRVQYFIQQKDRSKVEEICNAYWQGKILRKEQGKIGDFKISIEGIRNDNAPVTMTGFYDFAINRLSTTKRSTTVMTSLYAVLSSISKELWEHTDEEVEALLEWFKSRATNKESILDACMFIQHIQKTHNSRYTNVYSYKKHEAIENNRDVSAYTEEQFFRFGLLLLNDTHEWYQEYLQKAVSKRVNAAVWLYGLMHYVCAWRSVDMLNRLPRPTLGISAEKFIKLIREDKLPENMATKIVGEVEFKVQYLKPKPSKTKKYNPPPLVFKIPESAKFRLGMLLGLCEAHRQLANGNHLLVRDVKARERQIKFFGPEFEDIFGGNGFNNLRANKAFEVLMANKAEQMEIGTGYIIASISRSHKCTFEQQSNTTAIYLNNYRTLTKSDVLMRELFERGVCSFVPYLVLKTLEGQDRVAEMSLAEQTQRIKELIPYHPHDLENLLQVSDEVLERAKSDANLLIKDFSYRARASAATTESAKEAIYEFLNRIACGTAPAKENNMSCISVAKGIGCIYPERSTCIGCGQEIYLKSSLFVIGQRMRELVEKGKHSKTTAERAKYYMLVDKLFKPVLVEMMLVLRNVYGVHDVSEYREMVFGIGKTVKEATQYVSRNK